MRTVLIDALLGGIVLACWLGVIGMWRMRRPTEALHYLSLPTVVGGVLLTAAVFAETGVSSAGWKMAAIAVILVSFNAVVAHATARAFRVREAGHWESRNGDAMEWVRAREGRGQRGQTR